MHPAITTSQSRIVGGYQVVETPSGLQTAMTTVELCGGKDAKGSKACKGIKGIKGCNGGGMSYDHGFSVGRLGLYSKWLEYPCRFKSTSQRQIFMVI
ncbi:predicted protein [Plenodomus lingam JN3]|uniref:Predicted protein n=1 Tax=Leptosphaeria maculans (strain JN3 / isolate v23.1.3 / race Av1-4-5-6-7-8) TaxID=985895 RepID=E4ZPU8_LEPMJ|nr:predicted protein [Plenodomus lingam JN3]CBX93483.1 predicted protein [Plenodomus lingam JN3]